MAVPKSHIRNFLMISLGISKCKISLQQCFERFPMISYDFPAITSIGSPAVAKGLFYAHCEAHKESRRRVGAPRQALHLVGHGNFRLRVKGHACRGGHLRQSNTASITLNAGSPLAGMVRPGRPRLRGERHFKFSGMWRGASIPQPRSKEVGRESRLLNSAISISLRV